VEGGMVIGSSYSGTVMAPANSLLIENRAGIGTSTPMNMLDVEGGMVIGSSYSGSTIAPANGLLVEGRLGIGTNNPTVPLEVNGAIAANTGGAYQYLNSGGTGSGAIAVDMPVSIKASSRIMATMFAAVSDGRIKKNIINSSSQNDLATIMKMRVVDYQYKDSIYNGNTPIKGFIAQELATVMPQAIRKNGDFVPDLYCLSSSTLYNEKDKTLSISLCKPHNLVVGDKIKIIAADGMQEQYVSAITSPNSFAVNNWQLNNAGMNPVDKVFVWGKWVNDFHTVDHNQVFAMGISAIQQLAKENDELKSKVDLLMEEMKELKKIVTGK
jgi:hypothetical protein